MNQIIYFTLFALGLVLVIKGSGWFVSAVLWASTVFRIPYIIIGATVVSVCTTVPETFVSVTACIKGAPDVAFGNVLGSIALNTGVILPILVIFAAPGIENRLSFIRNGSFLLVLLLLLWLCGLIFGAIARIAGACLIVLLIGYLISNAFYAKASMDLDIHYDIESDDIVTDEPELYEGVSFDEYENDINISSQVLFKNILILVAGLAFVLEGSNLLVDNGVKIARLFSVPPSVIALTLTAAGASLPELATAVSAIRQKATSLGVGNIIGANILNIVQALGLSAVISPIPLDRDPVILTFQLPTIFLMVLLAFLFGFYGKSGYRRWQGWLIFTLYAIFMIVSIFREHAPFIGRVIFG